MLPRLQRIPSKHFQLADALLFVVDVVAVAAVVFDVVVVDSIAAAVVVVVALQIMLGLKSRTRTRPTGWPPLRPSQPKFDLDIF